jgi:hypothetical protein
MSIHLDSLVARQVMNIYCLNHFIYTSHSGLKIESESFFDMFSLLRASGYCIHQFL